MRIRVRFWVRGVQPIDIRQQDQAIRADHLRHSGCQPVVVAIADFRGRHGIVLIDDRYGAEAQQGVERAAGVEVASPLLGIPQRQKDLRHRDFVHIQQLFISVCEPNLSYGRRGLAFLQFEPSRTQIQVPPAQGNGAGGDEDDFLTSFAEGRHVSREALEPRAIQPPFVAIHQQG